jgi:hypothetical protein
LFLNYYKKIKPLDTALPAVIVNSFPKSGTHLLLQVIEALPGIFNYGTFVASLPSITYRERKQSFIGRKIKGIVPGEVVSAHLFYYSQYQELFKNKQIVHLFIYRDPRDVAVSEALYISNMNRWHRLHKRFNTLSSDCERIMLAITGDESGQYPFEYQNIAERFAKYQGWLKDENVLKIKFEDMVSENLPSVVDTIVECYLQKANLLTDRTQLIEKCIRNIDSSRSHTFRKGKSGGWHKRFSEKHKEKFKAIAGDLLIKLNYEKDYDW